MAWYEDPALSKSARQVTTKKEMYFRRDPPRATLNCCKQHAAGRGISNTGLRSWRAATGEPWTTAARGVRQDQHPSWDHGRRASCIGTL
jgi:hypothetical protein